MSRIVEPTPEQEAGYREWIASRPPAVRAVAEQFDPWSLYRLKTSGHRVTVSSFDEAQDGSVTLKALVTGEFNAVIFERTVFGVSPEDLEPCDLPSKNEMTGAMLSSEQVDENIDALRLMARPDIWEEDEDGKAVLRNHD